MIWKQIIQPIEQQTALPDMNNLNKLVFQIQLLNSTRVNKQGLSASVHTLHAGYWWNLRYGNAFHPTGS